jgi:hypothetical protein
MYISMTGLVSWGGITTLLGGHGINIVNIRIREFRVMREAVYSFCYLIAVSC